MGFFSRLLPEATSFFDFFEQHNAIAIQAGAELTAVVSGQISAAIGCERIKGCEQRADQLTHGCAEALKRTFITPFEREDIHSLITSLDDIVDDLDDVASRMVIYDIRELRPELSELVQVLVRALHLIGDALRNLRDLRHDKAIKKACIEIHQAENDADVILRSALMRLFKEEKNSIEVIKWKEIFERMEAAADRCEDVADVIQGVVIQAS